MISLTQNIIPCTPSLPHTSHSQHVYEVGSIIFALHFPDGEIEPQRVTEDSRDHLSPACIKVCLTVKLFFPGYLLESLCSPWTAKCFKNPAWSQERMHPSKFHWLLGNAYLARSGRHPHGFPGNRNWLSEWQ